MNLTDQDNHDLGIKHDYELCEICFEIKQMSIQDAWEEI